MTALRLLAVFFRIGLLNELQYRANFWTQLLKSVLDLGVSLAAVAVVYGHADDLNGWLPGELVALVGVFVLMGGLIGVVVQPSMERLTEDVREGTLDFTLTKPEESQVLVSVSQVRIWRVLDVVLGLAVIAGALASMGRATGAHEALLFGATLLAGAAILYSVWLMLATVSFWFVRVDNILVIFHSMYDTARWPVTIYPGWLQATLTFLVPVVFAVTVPSAALVGRLSATMLAATVGLALALLAASRIFWRLGVRHYSGASA